MAVIGAVFTDKLIIKSLKDLIRPTLWMNSLALSRLLYASNSFVVQRLPDFALLMT
ncbi:hypothetical protein SERLA73DRAFT_191188 [Serpula lacrymans var. lacrymans S7.3]|uniref:Uncharacterized protein n=2 Tax=Serpula lacrymans var. lacrymans TaxID=341189 RepID=F8QH22_SERL3|nr:uncharacterized protein SERLADRAFT_481144 [Serpula lacrymans var. lacrymans S7.9]EGN92423.1 hypothetical protein SERLA73DRAFT_191188 [Serpula lacrymans var. lacrymans S7.3]EGO18467.1 hypothetical protein SERLADRAFT_481144 [Serpula lacrymans var. lacrymans S7.9]